LILLLFLLPLLTSSQSSHDESLKVILCSSLICDPPKECDIYEGVPQCKVPPTTTTPTPITPSVSNPSTVWPTLPTFPTFPPFQFTPPPPPPAPPLPFVTTTLSPSSTSSPSVCSLFPDTGPCTRARIMWYFDTETNSCQRFSFSGCGNGNRFSSRYQCELRCLTGDKESEKTDEV
ncbi:hypothetical protein PFISCL1PPCAC_26202, partial [Pristionchus fissidentatus]